jgi:ribonuclease HIII
VSPKPRPDELTLSVIGLDEAGKGDYFGPLVVAAVAGSPEQLKALGVADSKRLSDGRVTALAAAIHTEFQVEVVAIHPVKYNELYAKMRNLNRLLAWCHATALENLLARTEVREVIVDKFASAHVLEKALKERGKGIDLTQITKGEAHPSVAAASIIARAEFLDRLAGLARRHDVELPKGAGAPVDQAGRRIMATGGEALLAQVAKLHFKNTQKIGSGT